MIQTVQLALADPVYAASVQEALVKSGPWRIISVRQPDARQPGVLVIDEEALEQLPLPLAHPERMVLVARKDPQHLSMAWEARIVSVVSVDDPPNTVLLAIMAAALRIPKANAAIVGGFSPNLPANAAPIPTESRPNSQKRLKNE